MLNTVVTDGRRAIQWHCLVMVASDHTIMNQVSNRITVRCYGICPQAMVLVGYIPWFGLYASYTTLGLQPLVV